MNTSITMPKKASPNSRKRKVSLTSDAEHTSTSGGIDLIARAKPEHKQKKARVLNGNEDTNKVVLDIKIEPFAENRSVEIQALTDVVKNVGGNHMAFQKLPRHMRRRAMSHNLKRVPRRLHTAVKSELEKTKAPGKRPSRRYRRRPSNLLKEYERRKRKIEWLETHIWHAKRFKMAEKWGFRLALHPNDKSVRSCYRAVSRHCLMQDVSYESYIEVKGPRQVILSALSHLTSEKTGPTFASRMTAMGTRQGMLMLYHRDSYPHNAIGQVTFLWRPKLTDDDLPDPSTLWICCHPSFYDEALKEIETCLEFEQTSINVSTIVTGSDTKIQQEDQVSKVCVISLRDQLVKFRLYGPASNRVLSETLQLASVDVEREKSISDKREAVPEETSVISESGSSMSAQETRTTEKDDEKTEPWWKSFYSRNHHFKAFNQQAEVWLQLTHCQSPAEAPANCVLGLSVRDPRILLPPKKNKVSIYNGSGYHSLTNELFTAEIGNSPLWEAEVREKIKATKIPEQKLNHMKSQQLVPGTPLQLGDAESRIPVLLIQRPGTSFTSLSSESGYASGWDILIPSGWAMAFWVALVYRGARIGGIREARSIAQHARMLSPAFDFPDTVSGKEEMKSESQALQTKHDRRPPAKRPNYTKLGFPSPFAFQFGKLVQEWIEKWDVLRCGLHETGLGQIKAQMPQKDGSFSVLRDKKMLKLLDSGLNGKQFVTTKDRNGNKKKGKFENEDALATILSCDVGKEMVEKHSTDVVPVGLKFLHRGMPAMFGHICQPSKSDLIELSRDKNYGGPLEMKHKDTEKGKRKEERKERLRQRRKKRKGKVDKKCLESESNVPGNEKKGDSVEEMEKVSVSTKEDTKSSLQDSASVKLISHTSRPIIGFVRNGDFDLVQGQGSGLGFCSVTALLHLIAEKGGQEKTVVLVRNPTSLQYRFSSISILI